MTTCDTIWRVECTDTVEVRKERVLLARVGRIGQQHTKQSHRYLWQRNASLVHSPVAAR